MNNEQIIHLDNDTETLPFISSLIIAVHTYRNIGHAMPFINILLTNLLYRDVQDRTIYHKHLTYIRYIRVIISHAVSSVLFRHRRRK